MRIRRTAIAAGLLIGMCPSLCLAADCSDLSRMRQNAGNFFQDLKAGGKKDDILNEYKSSWVLPDAHDCVIQSVIEGHDATFQCEWYDPDEQSAVVDFGAMYRAYAECSLHPDSLKISTLHSGATAAVVQDIPNAHVAIKLRTREHWWIIEMDYEYELEGKNP